MGSSILVLFVLTFSAVTEIEGLKKYPGLDRSGLPQTNYNQGWLAHRRCVNSQRLCKSFEPNPSSCGNLCTFVQGFVSNDGKTKTGAPVLALSLVAGGIVSNNPMIAFAGMFTMVAIHLEPVGGEMVERREFVQLKGDLEGRMDDIDRRGKKLANDFLDHNSFLNETWDDRVGLIEAKLDSALTLLDAHLSIANLARKKLNIHNTTLEQHHRDLDYLFTWSDNVSRSLTNAGRDIDIFHWELSNLRELRFNETLEDAHNTTVPAADENVPFLKKHAQYLHFSAVLFAVVLTSIGVTVCMILTYRYCNVRIYAAYQ